MGIALSEKQVKEGWTVVRFGQIAREFKKTTNDPAADGYEFYIGLDHLEPQSLRITRKGVIAEDNPTFTRCFSAGNILFGKRRSYQKKAAVADFDGICSGDIIVMEAIPKGPVVPKLLPFIVQSEGFFDWAEKTSMGSLSPRTKWSALAEYEFPLPPVGRQGEILEVLEKVEECDRKSADTQLAINTTGDIVAQHLFSKGVQNSIDFINTPVGIIPKHWQVLKFGSIILHGTQNGLYKGQDSYGTGVKMVHMAEMFHSSFISDNEGMQLVEVTEAELEKYSLFDQDILFARRSLTPEGAGLCCMYLGQAKTVTFESSIIRVSINQEIANPFFVNHFLRSKVGRWHLQRIIQTVAASGITGSDLKDFLIPLPPISEQNQIVGVLDSLRNAGKQLNQGKIKMQFLDSLVTNVFFKGNSSS